LRKDTELSDIDSPRTAALHASLIRSKPVLKKIYLENYCFFKEVVDDVPRGSILEVGSGGGFLKNVLPSVITSDVIKTSYVDICLSASKLPFYNNSLSGILMMDVFHHLQDIDKFLTGAQRCLMPGGKIAMIEPANTPWSRFIYKTFHHEPFDPNQEGWRLAPGGPMSQANGALPWIVLSRDRNLFEGKYPYLKIESMKFTCPFLYLISGGVSRRQFVPSFTYPFLKVYDYLLKPFYFLLGMFMMVVIAKSEHIQQDL
jgi:SAM-dependent methyltransferase